MVSLDAMKAHLNVTTDQDDDLITAKLTAAIDWVSDYISLRPESLPSFADEAVKQLVAYWYESREAGSSGVPQGVIDLLSPERAWVF
jgi:hypothetical protein